MVEESKSTNTVGNSSCTIPMLETPPRDCYVLLAAARSLMDGVEAMAVATPAPLLAMAFNAGFTLECVLKAYLEHTGWREVQLKAAAHNLKLLWDRCIDEKLQLGTPPHWASWLFTAHWNKAEPHYPLRYPVGLHGASPPQAQPMTAELRAFVDLVSTHVTARPPSPVRNSSSEQAA